MKIISINAGSSSLKFTLLELPEEKTIASGLFERIGIDGQYTIKFNAEKELKKFDLPNHEVAVQVLMDELINMKIISSLDDIEGVGHRIVHGGAEFSSSVVLNDEVIKKIDKYTELAPLHNPANLMGAKAFMSALPNVLQVGVFDTAFHSTMDNEEYLYPVPYEWYENYGIRRYGFHGTSHKFIYKTICEEYKNDKLKVISCHLGNGASLAAIDSGKVVDTSMGFTPLPGLMMGTRSGDIDPSIIEFMCKKTNRSVEDITNDLNKKSGLLGVSGVSADSRDVEKGIKEGNKRCVLAQNIYMKKIANYIAMYNNELNGADVICFTAGVGENGIEAREMIVNNIKSLGVKLDLELNNIRGEFRKISSENSKIDVYIVPTNEELMIALDVLELKK